MISDIFYKPLLILVTFSISIFGRAQSDSILVKDSLIALDYSILHGKSIEYEQDTFLAIQYTSAYLKKAKLEKNDFEVVRGYYLMAVGTRNFEESLKYCDSVIEFSNGKAYEKYPTNTYLFMGNQYQAIGNNKKALKYYLMADSVLEIRPNMQLDFFVKTGISSIKDVVQKEAKTSTTHKNTYQISKKIQDSLPKDVDMYSLLLLSNSFANEKRLDSASYYTKLGYEEAIRKRDTLFQNLFGTQEGIYHHHRGAFQISTDSLIKTLNYWTKSTDSLKIFATAQYFLGKNRLKMGNSEKALEYFRNVDTLLQKIGIYNPEFIENYEYLKEDAKRRGDLENQLNYTNILLKYDSIIIENAEVDRELVRKFDTPQLLNEKEDIIAQLKKDNQDFVGKNYALIILSSLLAIIGVFFFWRQQIYKRRFEKLMDDRNNKKGNNNDDGSATKISEEKMKEILDKIEAFEQKKGFLNKSINLVELAKHLGTNSNYLSKVINLHKKKNFSRYLTDLRIDHAVEAMKSEPKLLRYTIKAIAFDSGFGSSESFTRAFHKKTGIYPSYFVKQLKKRNSF